jgi:hypothetical protein
MVGFCGNGNELSGSITTRYFFTLKINYQLLKENLYHGVKLAK